MRIERRLDGVRQVVRVVVAARARRVCHRVKVPFGQPACPRRARLHRSRGAGGLPPPQVEELDHKRQPSGSNEGRSRQKAR